MNAGISDGRGEDNHTFRRVTNGRKSMCFYMVANELFIYLFRLVSVLVIVI